ncbi:MAG: IS66 family transposase, partial [Nocardioidaceae bacterium]
MPDAPTYEQLLALVEELSGRVVELSERNAVLTERVAELERRLSADSSNSSRPPSSDLPWGEKPAKKRSSRVRSGRRPGKQAGAGSSSRSLVDDPDEVVVIEPERCQGCDVSLADAPVRGRDRRQVVDVAAVPPPRITEYQRVSKVCSCCGAVTVPGWNTGDDRGVVVSPPGSPVRIGPETMARAALLTCGHYLPVGRSRQLLEALTGMEVSTGFLAGVRGRAARKLEKTFLSYLRELLATAPVLHADETTGRAAGKLSYVHVACTEYLTLMHVGGRSADDIDAGGVLPAFNGVLVRDGYAGYSHLTQAIHAWCGAHLLRDLRSISDADPDGQLWAKAMADTLLDAHHAARHARQRDTDRLDDQT